MNMKEWYENTLESNVKKPMPLLFQPGVQLVGTDLKTALSNSDVQRDVATALAEMFDTAVCFGPMDLSVEAEAFGSELNFASSGMGYVKAPIVSVEEEKSIAKLRTPSVGAGRTGIFVEGIRKIAENVTDRPVFAQVAGPFSLAGQLMGLNEIMMATIESPDLVEELLNKTVFFVTQYIKALRDAGANGVLIVESTAGLLSPSLNAEFSEPYLEMITTATQSNSFLTGYHNCARGAAMQLGNILDCGCKLFHFGDCIDLDDVKMWIPENIMFAGNISPTGYLVNSTPQKVREKVEELKQKCGNFENFMLSSGCDIPFDAKIENIKAMF